MKDEEVDIFIGYNQVSVKPDENLKALAYDTLRHAIDDDEAYGQSGDKLVYGNTLGVELIKEGMIFGRAKTCCRRKLRR